MTLGQAATDRAGIMIDSVSNTLTNTIVFNTALGTDFPGIRLNSTGNVLSGIITANLAPATFSGSGSGAATLTGQITGAQGLTLETRSTDSLTITLNNAGTANNFTGGTTISFGTVITSHATALGTGNVGVSGSIAILKLAGTTLANSVALTNSGTLSGSGGVGTLSAASGGTISPGNSPGTLTAGNTTFGGGGAYTWEINNASGVSGTNYDLLSISGTLAITATSGSRFTLNLTSLLADNTAGNVINFSSTQNYSYTIATASSGITGFDASVFTLNTASFSNTLDGGTWSLAANGNNLNLNFTASAIPEPSTYAAIFGAAVLAFAAYRKRQNRSHSA